MGTETPSRYGFLKKNEIFTGCQGRLLLRWVDIVGDMFGGRSMFMVDRTLDHRGRSRLSQNCLGKINYKRKIYTVYVHVHVHATTSFWKKLIMNPYGRNSADAHVDSYCPKFNKYIGLLVKVYDTKMTRVYCSDYHRTLHIEKTSHM